MAKDQIYLNFFYSIELISQNILNLGVKIRIIVDFSLYLQRKFILVYKQNQQKLRL